MGTNQYNEIGGVETSLSVRFSPWMGLSDTRVYSDIRMTDAYEAHRLASIDWQVEEMGLETLLPTHPLADEYKMRVRSTDGSILGIGSPAYGVIQNDQVAQLAQAIMEFRPDAHIESAGALHHGKVVWNLVKLDDAVKRLTHGESHFRYLLVYTSHDGSKPFAVRFTNVRVQCMNTFSMALGRGSELLHKVRHTNKAIEYVKEAHDSVKNAIAAFDLMDLEIERLCNVEMSKSDVFAAFKATIGEPTDSKRGMTMWEKQFDAIVDEYNKDFNAQIKGTAWGTVMAVNGYELWEQGSRGQTKADKQMQHLIAGKYPMTAKVLSLVGAA